MVCGLVYRESREIAQTAMENLYTVLNTESGLATLYKHLHIQQITLGWENLICHVLHKLNL